MNTITTLTSDKCLWISGSTQYINRKMMDIPSDAIEIRAGLFLNLGGNSATASFQTFTNATISQTWRFCLTAGPNVIPGVTYGNYFGIGQNIGATSDISAYSADNNAYSYSSNNIRQQYSSSYTVTPSGDSNTQFMIKNNTSRASWHMFRWYKSSTTEIVQAYYHQPYYNTDGFGGVDYPITMPIPSSTYDAYLSRLNLYANGTYTKNVTYTFSSQSDRDAVFSSINTMFFAWPYYSIPLYVLGMEYKVL